MAEQLYDCGRAPRPKLTEGCGRSEIESRAEEHKTPFVHSRRAPRVLPWGYIIPPRRRSGGSGVERYQYGNISKAVPAQSLYRNRHGVE